MNKKEFTIKDMEKRLFKTKKDKQAYEEEFLYLSIAHQIAELRAEKHMSQKEFAKLLNTKQQVVSRIEHDNYKPSITTLEKIAVVFNKKLLVKFV